MNAFWIGVGIGIVIGLVLAWKPRFEAGRSTGYNEGKKDTFAKLAGDK